MFADATMQNEEIIGLDGVFEDPGRQISHQRPRRSLLACALTIGPEVSPPLPLAEDPQNNDGPQFLRSLKDFLATAGRWLSWKGRD